MLAAVGAGNSRARLWLGPPPERAGILWDQANNVIYLAGGSPAEAPNEVLGTIRAAALALGRPRFGLRVLGPAAADLDAPGLTKLALTRRTKRFYTFPRLAAPAPPADGGAEFVLITGAWLAGGRLRNLERVRAEVEWMWPSLDRFAQRGFGVAAVRGDAVVCWCTAEYVGGRSCGIGIETDEAVQRQGLATATAARFVTHSLGLGLAPHWECDSQNAGSVRVAEKVGFELAQALPMWVGLFR